MDVVSYPHTGGARGLRRLVLPVFAVATLLFAPAALAHDAYLTDSGSESVSVIDTATDEVVGEPIAVGSGPGGIAITPDGGRVYVANRLSGTVSVIDTATDEVVGEPIAVGLGSKPRGVAVTPDGKRVYVVAEGLDTVQVIDTATDEVVGEPIAVGSEPFGIAITPDGTRAYVTDSGSESVSVIDTATDEVVGEPIAVGASPWGIAIAPDGGRVYEANLASGSISVIDTATDEVVGEPIAVAVPTGIAITPDGSRVYVGNHGSATVTVIDTASEETVGEPIAVGTNPLGLAITPDGSRVYVASGNTESVSVIDTATDEVVGEPIAVGTTPLAIAIVPDQPPLASLAAAVGDAGGSVQLDASASHDPDGQIARYAWSFGDGQTAPDAGPTPTHTFSAPGTYRVTVTTTDSEGCSTSFVFTGLTALCNGSSLASATRMVEVAAPQQSKPAPPVVIPSNAFLIRKLRHNRRRGIAKLRVWVPGPGALLLRGRSVRTVKRAVAGRRALTLTVRAKRKEMKVLKRHGHLWVWVRVTFRPNGGVAHTLAKKLKLIRRSSRPAHRHHRR